MSEYDTDIVCRMLQVSKSGYYSHKIPNESKISETEKAVINCFKKHKRNYGRIRIRKELLNEGMDISEYRIARILKKYSIVYMFGVDKTLVDKVRIETCANNNNETINTDFDIHYLEKMLRSGKISYTVSDKPTHYLCNAAYYHMLKKNPNTVFIHIPSLMGMSIEMMNRLIRVFRDIYFV